MTQQYPIGSRVIAQVVNNGMTCDRAGKVDSYDQDNNEYAVLLDKPIYRFGGPVKLVTMEADELRQASKNPWEDDCD